MVHVSKFTTNERRVLDRAEENAYKRSQPRPQRVNPPVYRNMQNIIDKAKRGEKL